MATSNLEKELPLVYLFQKLNNYLDDLEVIRDDDFISTATSFREHLTNPNPFQGKPKNGSERLDILKIIAICLTFYCSSIGY